MTLLNNTNLTAGTTRYLIPIREVEKRFNLSVFWSGVASAGTNARIMFGDIWDETNADQAAALASARGVTKPELVLDLALSPEREHLWFVFPIYAHKCWLEINVVGTLNNVTVKFQQISNTER
jgi:hypothetical protein